MKSGHAMRGRKRLRSALRTSGDLKYGDGDAPAERPGDAPHERDDRRADLNRGNGEEHEQHVLPHVGEEELVRERVEGADEGYEGGR